MMELAMSAGDEWTTCTQLKLEDAVEIDTELSRIEAKNGPMYHSLHEAYGVMLEELDEVWEITKLKRQNRNPEDLRKELIQVAATAIRAIHSISRFVGE